MFSHRGLFLAITTLASIVLANVCIQPKCCCKEQLPKIYPYHTMMLKQIFVNRPDLFVGSPQPLDQPSTTRDKMYYDDSRLTSNRPSPKFEQQSTSLKGSDNKYRSFKLRIGGDWEEEYETTFVLRWIEFWWPKIFGTTAPVKLKQEDKINN